MATITRELVMNYWTSQVKAGKETYTDTAGEIDYTYMGEDAAWHFRVDTEDGQSEIEKNIFEWATEMIFII